MSKAVRYDEFGGIDVLRVDEVERPVPADGQVLVRVKAAGINISEAVIRTGAVAHIFPSTFPSGQGSDLAGVIEEVGAGLSGFSPGDEVIGFSNNRASQAELALVEAGDLIRKPEKVSWEAAGGLYVAGTTAWGAVRAVHPTEGETVIISGAAGGVGSLAVQLARRTGATVIGLASDSNHEWLKSHGVIPVAYGNGVAGRIHAAAPGGVAAFIDSHGGGYVELALDLGVAADWIDTIADYAAAAKYGVKTDRELRLGGAPRCSPSWSARLTADSSRCRSPMSIRWIRSARPTPSLNAATPTARSSSGRNEGRTRCPRSPWAAASGNGPSPGPSG